MFSPAAKFATVLHLGTGHVLAAISSVGPEPKLEDLAGGGVVRMRIPATDGFVNVPVSLLTATRIAINDDNSDVLDRPTHYDLLSGSPPPLGLRGPPLMDAFGDDPDHANAKVILIWQIGDQAVVEDDLKLTDKGELEVVTPTGATHVLVAIQGGALHLVGEGG